MRAPNIFRVKHKLTPKFDYLVEPLLALLALVASVVIVYIGGGGSQ